MKEAFYSPQARIDLKDIYRQIAEHNPAAASGVLRHIGTKAGLMAESPLIGQAAEELAPQLRRLPVGAYLIFYRPTDFGIEVVRVLHGARDIDALFQDVTLE